MDIGATAKLSASGAKLLPGMANWFKTLHERRQSVNYAKEILGVDRSEEFNYRVSMDHPLLQHGVSHADDLAAFDAVAGPSLAYAFDNGWVEYPEDIEADLDQGMVLIGSPESEALTRLAFGYRRLPGNGGMGYVGDTIDLPYRWEEQLDLVSATCRRFVPGRGLTTRPNWPVVDNTLPQSRRLYPAVTNDGFLDSDFLLITRTPNFLTTRGQQSGRSIVSIAGTHGVGTRSIQLVLRSRRVLRQIAEQVPSGTRAFQVLVEARSIVHDPIKASIARSVIVRGIQCFDRPDSVWSEARRAVNRRYTDWASDVFQARERNQHLQLTEDG